jgi:hypothetical protein
MRDRVLCQSVGSLAASALNSPTVRSAQISRERLAGILQAIALKRNERSINFCPSDDNGSPARAWHDEDAAALRLLVYVWVVFVPLQL